MDESSDDAPLEPGNETPSPPRTSSGVPGWVMFPLAVALAGGIAWIATHTMRDPPKYPRPRPNASTPDATPPAERDDDKRTP